MTNIPSHPRKIALIASYGLVFSLFGCFVPAHAQFVGYVGLQTVTSTFTGTCNGSFQTFNVPNNGQTSHYVFYNFTSGLPTFVQVQLQGSNDGAGFSTLSNTASQVLGGEVQASGYYNVVRVQINCNSGPVFSLKYSGSNAPPTSPMGTTLRGVNEQLTGYGASAGSNTNSSLQTPYGSSSGGILFSYQGGAGPANSTILVTCFSAVNNAGANGGIVFGPFTLQTTVNTSQYFPIPPTPCPDVQVVYTSGGASANTINLLYEFNPPGSPGTATLGTHITGTTATVVKATSGFLHSLTINLGGAGTISVFDLPSASCTGTPATNQVAIITATATTLQTFTYDVTLLNGICVKASVAMDITVSSQ